MKLKDRFPSDAMLNYYWLPSIEAAGQLSRGKPAKAIELLKAAGQHEMDSPSPLELSPFYPVYLRGEALLAVGDGAAAAAEFEKITAHPGLVVNFPLGALAQVELARAYALQNDGDRSRAAYERFLEIWKSADPDLAVHKRALAEHAKYASH